jgi:uncharacterized protein (TIGR02246 family)
LLAVGIYVKKENRFQRARKVPSSHILCRPGSIVKGARPDRVGERPARGAATRSGKLNAHNPLEPCTMKKDIFLLPLVALILTALPLVHAQSAAEDEAAIRAAITSQAGAWNQGNIDGFMQAYEDSKDTTFVGQNTHKGYQQVLQRYKDNYSGPAEMGKLSFSDIDVRLLPNGCGKTELALATGRFHLDNTTKSKKEGVFSLVWRKGPHGWKIILDHTS